MYYEEATENSTFNFTYVFILVCLKRAVSVLIIAYSAYLSAEDCIGYELYGYF